MPLTDEQRAFAEAVEAKFLKYQGYAEQEGVAERTSGEIKRRIKLIQALHAGLLKGPDNAGLIIVALQQHIQALKAWKPKPVGADVTPLPNLSDVRKIQWWQELFLDGGIYYLDASGRGMSRPMHIERRVADGWFCFVILVAKPGRVLVAARADGGHTTLSAGADVLYAGEIHLGHGKILAWNNESGHYRPPEDLHVQAAHLLPVDKFTAHVA